METIRNIFNQNWIGIIVGIIAGFLISDIFYRLSRVRARIAVQKRSFTIIEPNLQVEPSDVEIFFRGIKVPRVTLSVIAIWNCGNTTIEGSKIVESDPLRIVTTDISQIIEVREIQTRVANKFKTIINLNRPNELICTFDFLDTRDGVRLTLLHSGDTQVNIEGTLRGIPQGVEDFGVLKELKQN